MIKNCKVVVYLASVLLLVFLSGCSQLAVKQAIEKQRPKVDVERVRLSGLTFDSVTLNIGVKVDNPNPIPIKLAGLDYDFKLAGQSFFKGDQNKPLTVKAAGVSIIELPVTIGFSDLKKIFKGTSNQDSAAYSVDLGLLIDVPILGQYRQPLSHKGTIPVPHLPAIKVADFSLQQLNFSEAKVALKLEVDNPNAFAVALDKLDYSLNVNGSKWAGGIVNKVGNIKQKGKSVITLPLSLSFKDLGMGLFKTLSSGDALNYDLSGKLNATSSNKLIGKFELPIDRSGVVKLSR